MIMGNLNQMRPHAADQSVCYLKGGGGVDADFGLFPPIALIPTE